MSPTQQKMSLAHSFREGDGPGEMGTPTCVHRPKAYLTFFFISVGCKIYLHTWFTHPDSSDRLRRSHIECCTAVTTASWNTFEGTLKVLCSYCNKSYRVCSSCRVPLKYSQRYSNLP